ncbi:endonuclease III [Ornithobacterium rhinotracheale]|uniref:Endonuclease III n=1 Tax=Ornithobacterium rhinotracheale (strain ATCC 51463 / DSM 15997 / CCUG 23171 / CIP 104009 / LMG 9086) TaxID=867902 RepID=I3ZZ85_ORNRL|nr:endonuclease III [Ornithobacterium rhinotracheale]AFL97019.1 endonuclease III, DNA-(apurinic or apyrimidinic site) lyase [Ornithobacterium rhinotracheale DSM 15997]AIP99150.1 endonuclease III [Ornithobacterium rhinotracheale ORT-UMN 88]KGB67029.1 endonuclease III [Ornithobacterium rhinotracheale H06-030791]MBN3663006.1 endonuclease III [Ornithobacterium rhinotracheale]MCK0194463.1 endonuclease III [Ornithobacterium rhinotracheale]
MTKQEKVDFVVSTLEELYPNPPIALDHSDPYTLLVAVALSAQTTDKKVNEITPNLFAVADTPSKMAKLSPEHIKELITGIGLTNTKSKNLQLMAQQLMERHQGVVPDNFEDLEALAGVGHKTASVVMSQAFGVPAFPVDTHIHRLMYRWGLSNGKSVEQTEKDAKRLFPKELWNKLHLQIIYYGREYSPARGLRLEKDVITRTIGRKSFLNEIKK